MEIEAQGVGKRFGRFQALRGLDFRLPAGSRTGLVGHNGAGKTTLIRALMGMLRVEGKLQLGGIPAGEASARLASRLAYVAQIAPRLAAPAGEIALGVARLRGQDVARVIESADAMGIDLKGNWKKPFWGLSGGMRQRLMVAMALAFPVGLYILDEPTAALDPEGRQRFFEHFRRVSEGATVLLSSHRLEELRHLVAHVLVLKEGRLAFEGPAETLLGDHGGGMIEACAAGEEGKSRLRVLGFSPMAAGWWFKAVDREGKRRLLPELSRMLGRELSDLQVRDMDHLVLGDNLEAAHAPE